MAARTATKQTSQKTRSTAKDTKNTIREPQEETSSSLVWLLVAFAVSILLFVGILGFGGPFGDGIRMILFGVFGIFAFLVPFAIIGGALYSSVYRARYRIPASKIIFGVISFVLLAALVELFLHGENTLGAAGAFSAGGDSHGGGGFIGGLFSGLFVQMFGLVGAFVITFAMLVICVVVLTEDSKPMIRYRSNKDIRQKRRALRRSERESRREREEEFRRRHEENRRRMRATRSEKFEGISRDTRILPDVDLTPDMGELKGKIPVSTGPVPTNQPIQMPQPAMEDPLVAETVKESQAPTETAGGVPISPERRPEERIPAASRYTDGIREISLDTLRREQDVVREEIPEAPQSILPDPTGIYIPRSDPDEPLGSYRNEYDEIRDVFDEEPIYASAHKEKPAASAVEVMSEKPVASTVEALSEAPDIRESLSGESAFEAEETLEEEPSKHVMPEEVVDSFIPEIVPMNRTEETKDAAIEEGSAEVLSEEEVSAAAGGLLFKEDASRIPETVTEEPEPAEAAQYSMEAATPTEEPYLSEAAESTEERYPMEAAEAERFSEETERESAVSGFSLELSAGSEQPSEADRISMEPISEMAREAEEEVFPAKPEYHLPPVELLSEPVKSEGTSQAELVETSERLRTTLANFGVNVTITDAVCGPTVTRYELQPEKGVKVSKIVNLSDDIKLNLAAADIRIEAPIPGKPAIGIEVPNSKPSVVSFRELMESDEFQRAASPITFAAGRDIGGKIMISDIAKMPHVLIAGATGAGKSVCINTIIMSILYKAMPDEVKFIMIDPKVVELSVYNGIPHLLIPVVTDPKKAAGALAWAVKEMMDRYDKFAKTGVRDMKGYNARIMNGVIHYDMNGQSVEAAAEKMPQIVVIVDELADLMMVASHEVEESICRLAQLARAAGIHLVIATQRPSVNVITGLIKANMPSRIAFAVTSGVDSRTILDMVGAEKLLGKGDMLYYPQGLPKPLRVQGAFVSDKDVARVVDFIRKETGPVEYSQDIDIQMQEAQEQESSPAAAPTPDRQDEKDVYFDEAVRILTGKKKASISMLQRYLKIGFNRAARIMDQLEEAGIVGPDEGTMGRKVLADQTVEEAPAAAEIPATTEASEAAGGDEIL